MAAEELKTWQGYPYDDRLQSGWLPSVPQASQAVTQEMAG